MGNFKLFLSFFCSFFILVASAENVNTDFESMITARIMNLEKENSELKNELKAMKSSGQSKQGYGTKYSFDCYLNDGYHYPTEDGVINFDGCSVDLSTQDPMSGRFVVPEPGIWRFTFSSVISGTNDYALVYLKVDGQYAASSQIDPDSQGEDISRFPIHINSLLNLTLTKLSQLNFTPLTMHI